MRFAFLLLAAPIWAFSIGATNLILAQPASHSPLQIDATPERYGARVLKDASLKQLPVFPRNTLFARPMVPSRYMIIYGIANPGDNGTFGVIDFRLGELVKRFEDPAEKRQVDIITISPDGRLAALRSKRATGIDDLEVYDLVAGKRIASKNPVMWGSVQNQSGVLAFLDDKRLLHGDISDARKSFSVIEARTGRRLIQLGDKHMRTPGNEIGISPAGRYLATGGNSYFKIWDTTSGETVLDIAFPQVKKNGSYLPSFDGTSFSADGKSVLACLSYGNLLEVHHWSIPDLTRSVTEIPLGSIRPSKHLGATALQQIPGTELWVYYNLAVVHPKLTSPLATLDPENRVTNHGHQWVVNDRLLARRVIAPQRGDTRWFWGLKPVPIPQEQIEHRLHQYGELSKN